MKCPECGAEIDKEFGFCIRCGAEPSTQLSSADTYRKEEDTRLLKVLTVVVIGLILFAMLFGFFLPLAISPSYRNYPKETSFTVDRVIELQSTGQKKYSIDFPKFKDFISGVDRIQEITNVSFSPTNYKTIKNIHSYDWLYWNGTLLPNKKLTVKASYTVKIKFHEWNLNQTEIGDISDVPLTLTSSHLVDEWRMVDDMGVPIDRDKDLRQDMMIEPSSPVINKTLQQIINASKPSNAFDTVKAVYNYIVDNIRYPTESEIIANEVKSAGMPRHALWALKERIGDCDEQTALFLSLVRAAGYPCWFAFGALYSRSTDIFGGHAWAVVYIPLKSGSGVNIVVDTTNREFNYIDPYHLTAWEDVDANSSALLDYYSYLMYTPESPVAFANEKWDGISYSESADTVRIYDQESGNNTITGLEWYVVLIAIVLAIVIIITPFRQKIRGK